MDQRGHILGSCLYLYTEPEDRQTHPGDGVCLRPSVIENYVMSEAEKHDTMLYLCVDEHTGEAGLLTRLEALFDSCKLGRQPGYIRFRSAREW